MEYTRIRTYDPKNGSKWTGLEHLYSTNDQAKALERFKRDYPEHKEMIAVAEHYNSEEDPRHYRACLQCGVID